MDASAQQFIDDLRAVAKNNFKSAVRSEALSPAAAAQALGAAPSRDGFRPADVASHVGKLSGANVHVAISDVQIALTVSLPGDRRAAFDWAHTTLDKLGASNVKMNFGKDKNTDVKIFWGRPDVNTLVDIGGSDD